MIHILAAMMMFAAPQAPADSTHALLEEVKQLRQAIQALTANTQRSQILIYRLQSQEASVVRALQRVDEVRSRISSVQNQKRNVEGEAKMIEAQHAQRTDSVERQRLEEALAGTKTRIAAMEALEADLQTHLSEAQEQLKLEQSRRGLLEDQMTRLDKDLEDAAKPPRP